VVEQLDVAHVGTGDGYRRVYDFQQGWVGIAIPHQPGADLLETLHGKGDGVSSRRPWLLVLGQRHYRRGASFVLCVGCYARRAGTLYQPSEQRCVLGIAASRMCGVVWVSAGGGEHPQQSRSNGDSIPPGS